MNDVVVVGGGPTGLLLAAELRLAGADPLVLEAADDAGRQTRSLGMRGINGRSVQTLELRGLTGPLAEAQWGMFARRAADRRSGDATDEIAPLVRMLRDGRAKGHFAGLPLVEEAGERSGIPELFLLKQHLLEQVLLSWARELGVRIWPGCPVVDVIDEGSAVVAVLADGRSVRGAYLVGCDGGRSVVRKRAGIDFPGTAATMTGRTAVAELADPDAVRSVTRGPGGLVNLSLVAGEVATIEFDGGPDERDAPVTVKELEASIRRASGVPATVARLGAGIRYSDNTRQAATYRRGRVLLAGDAAHVHSPIGGQGLNLGMQDAVNLGWKLGLVVRGLAPEGLLDTYTAERHPVGARVLRNTRAQVALMRPGPQVDALRLVLGELLADPATKRHLMALVNNTDIDYGCSGRSGSAGPVPRDDPDRSPTAHPLVGRFTPPLPLEPAGRAAVAAALREGRAVLLDLADSPETRAAAGGHTDRVRVVCAGDHSGPVDGVAGLLIRPDGYVAWASPEAGPAGLPEALHDWLGPANRVRVTP
ncbi:FAD-dependent monooxygenase [Rugosimonospora acidiphila]|uniref:FAD-dependent monooxygenase n=1 Tax=Rugosimonospora acidiphila TaxID=556531 RepID=A0ABP9S7P2_9ACTN